MVCDYAVEVSSANCLAHRARSGDNATMSGSPVAISINALTSNFTTASMSLATVAGANATLRLLIQAFSTTNYTGTIYVDEIDLK